MLALLPSIVSNLLIAVFATKVVHTATTPDAAERGMWLVFVVWAVGVCIVGFLIDTHSIVVLRIHCQLTAALSPT